MIDEVHRWLKLMVAVLVATVFGVLAPSTTTASAIAYSYDLSAIARVEVDAYAASEVGFAQVAAQWEGSASPSVKAQAAPTTPPASFVATNSADDLVRLGTKDSWGKLSTLDDHFARHGADFGATSADDYARQASEFLQQPGTLTKIDPKTGAIRAYDPATNSFGAYNATGTTRTFYKPDPAQHGYPTNLDYWNAQPG